MNQDFIVKFDSDGNCTTFDKLEEYEKDCPSKKIKEREKNENCYSGDGCSNETYPEDYSFNSCYEEKEDDCSDEIEDKECDTHRKTSRKNRRGKSKRAYEKGYKEGYDAGKSEGFECGVTEGFRKGVQAGIARIYKEIMMKTKCRNKRYNKRNCRY